MRVKYTEILHTFSRDIDNRDMYEIEKLHLAQIETLKRELNELKEAVKEVVKK
jgi:hypothetical protein